MDLLKYLILVFMEDTFHENVCANGWKRTHVLARREEGWLIEGDDGIQTWVDQLTVEDFDRMLYSEINEQWHEMMNGFRQPCLWEEWKGNE